MLENFIPIALAPNMLSFIIYPRAKDCPISPYSEAGKSGHSAPLLALLDVVDGDILPLSIFSLYADSLFMSLSLSALLIACFVVTGAYQTKVIEQYK